MAATTSAATRGRGNRQQKSVSRPKPARIRWDRISRYALLLVFMVLVLLYIGPARSYIHTVSESNPRSEQVRPPERQHAKLEARKRALADPHVVEAEAPRLGAVRPGERLFQVR